MIQHPLVNPSTTLLGERVTVPPQRAVYSNQNSNQNPNGVDKTPSSDTFTSMAPNKSNAKWWVAAGAALTAFLFRGKIAGLFAKAPKP